VTAGLAFTNLLLVAVIATVAPILATVSDVAVDAVTPVTAAALVSAGLLSTVWFPTLVSSRLAATRVRASEPALPTAVRT
jgi:hypothetical protein